MRWKGATGTSYSAQKTGLDEDAVLLTQVARRRCHDRALADYNFAVLFEGLANVILADEVDGRLYSRCKRCRRWGRC